MESPSSSEDYDPSPNKNWAEPQVPVLSLSAVRAYPDRPYQSSLGTKINWYCPDLADGFAVFHHGMCIHYKKDTILQNLWVNFFLPSANICWALTRRQVGSMILPHGWSTSKESASPQPSSWCFWKDWLGFFWPSGPPFRSICYFILIGHLNIVVVYSIHLNGVLIKSELNLQVKGMCKKTFIQWSFRNLV